MFNLFKMKTKEFVDQNVSSIDGAKSLFKKSFWPECKKESIDVPEINDDILDAVLERQVSVSGTLTIW